jgi:hypothetical protein
VVGFDREVFAMRLFEIILVVLGVLVFSLFGVGAQF